jgi:diguanylate cyclase (GGDEF)-like protein
MQDTTQTLPDITIFGRFSSPALEKAYRSATWKEYARRYRISCLLTAAAYASAIFVDHLDLGQGPEFTTMLMMRGAAALAGFATAAATAIPRPNRLVGALLLVYILLISASESVELVLKWDMWGPYPGLPAQVFIILLFYLFLPYALVLNLAGGVAGSAVFLWAVAAHTPATEAYVLTVALFLILGNLFGAYFLAAFSRAERIEHRALQEEKYLNHQLQNEIAERLKAEARLLEMAITDDLTGLANRRHFMDQARREMLRAHRFGHPLSLLMIDVDHFKSVNDRFGHAAGDQALVHLAGLLKNNMRDIDLCARIGGEEFVALLPQTALAEAGEAAERIRAQVASTPVAVDAASILLTVSIGMAAANPGIEEVDDLIRKADRALYMAKRLGRNRCQTEV